MVGGPFPGGYPGLRRRAPDRGISERVINESLAALHSLSPARLAYPARHRHRPGVPAGLLREVLG